MQIIPFLYLLFIPFLIIASVVSAQRVKLLISKSIMQVMNILLLIYALYQIRLLIGIIQLLRSLNSGQSTNEFWLNYIDQSVIRTVVSILLPLCFVVPFFRKSQWFSLGVMVYYLNITELPDFDLINWALKLAHFLSWFSLVYALFWLKKWLPINQIQL